MATYDTYINADTYFESRLHVATWRESTTAQKIIALVEATQRIDRLRFRGTKVIADQDLEFPRYYGDEAEGDETVPEDIKIASYELALALLDGVDPDMEFENLAVVGHAYSSVRMTKLSDNTLAHIAAGIPNATAWRHLLPYLASSKTIRMHRVT